GSIVDIIEPCQEIDQCGLPCTSCSYHRHPGTCRYVEVYIIQYRLTRQIAEGDIFKTNRSLRVGKGYGIREIFRLCLFIHNFKYSLRTGHCSLKVVVDVGNIYKRPGKLPGIEQKAGYGSYREPA